MKNRKILFVVEGRADEKNFIEKLYSVCFADETYSVFPYETNIHVLINQMFVNDDIDDGFDLVKHLYSRCHDKNKKYHLMQSFSDIFLVFDLEPHDSHFDAKKIAKLQEYFNDSTDNGKLYINYPMYESYRNIGKMPDQNFRNSRISLTEVPKYKEFVNTQTPYYTSITALDKKTIFGLAAHHLRKFNCLLYGRYRCDLPQNEVSSAELIKILKKQIDEMEINQSVAVLSTLMLHIFEFQPTKMLNLLSQVSGDYFGFDI